MSHWTDLTDDSLLKMRIKDLSVQLAESDVRPWIQQVLGELKERLPLFQPHIFVGDEWFSPEGEPAVSIPFFLLHPRLRSLEKKMILECEGDLESEFLRLLRHELGHCFDHAFKVSRRTKWQKIFGSPLKDYDPDTYHPRPYSRNYVQNLRNWYAQAHPDEDFAETFAVWLNPHSNWRNFYKGWGALKKLEYVDQLAKEFADISVVPAKGRMISEARYLTSTLKRYYDRKIKDRDEDYPDFYDRDLMRIFGSGSTTATAQKAFRYLKENEKFFLNATAQWTGEKKATVSRLLSRLITRCRELELVVSKSESETAAEVSAFLATLVSHYLFTGHFKRTV